MANKTYKVLVNKSKKTYRVYEYIDGKLVHKYLVAYRYRHDFEANVVTPDNFEKMKNFYDDMFQQIF